MSILDEALASLAATLSRKPPPVEPLKPTGIHAFDCNNYPDFCNSDRK